MFGFASALPGWNAAIGLVTWTFAVDVYFGVCWAVYARASPRQSSRMTRMDHFRRRSVARYSRKSMVPLTGMDWLLMDRPDCTPGFSASHRPTSLRRTFSFFRSKAIRSARHTVRWRKRARCSSVSVGPMNAPARSRRGRRAVLAVAVLAATLQACSSQQQPNPVVRLHTGRIRGPLSTEGTRILDANGQTVRFLGVDVGGMGK